MRTRIATVGLLALIGCTPAPPMPAPPPPAPTVQLDEDFHVPPPVESVRDVMTAKLAHAHALLEGIALGDHRQIEINALDLQRLSEEAGWRVHTTVAYGLFSDQFGEQAATLATAARGGDHDAIAGAYAALIVGCVRCHDYMKSEGLYRDQPGKLSHRGVRPSAGDGHLVLSIDSGASR